jgi:hypothetical protein
MMLSSLPRRKINKQLGLTKKTGVSVVTNSRYFGWKLVAGVRFELTTFGL